MTDALLSWWHLGILTKRRHELLLTRYGSLEQAYERLSAALLSSLGCRKETVERVLHRAERMRLDALRTRMEALGVGVLALDDARYPAILRTIHDPPAFLSFRGDPAALYPPGVGMVGTRGMTSYGANVVRAFVPPLVRAGMATVSGLALGIDTDVATETLREGGTHIAVLANGLGSVYPAANHTLAGHILSSGGLLLSEQPLDYRPETFAFPGRNRIIAGLCRVLVVCQAPQGSGAVITAELALEYAREVCAVPGSIFEPACEGCNTLIASGQARLALSPADVLHACGVLAAEERRTPAFTPSSPHEQAVYGMLAAAPHTVDELVENSGLTADIVGISLTMMELAGAVRQAGEGKWMRA